MDSPPSTPLAPIGPRREIYRAMHDYKSRNEYEATLIRGDVVIVTDDDAKGWSLVKTKTGLGWVPTSYVEPIATLFQPQDIPTIPASPEPFVSEPWEPPNPLVGQPCDQCQKANADCKLDSDICDRCDNQGLLCTSSAYLGNALYVKGGWDKQGICVACRAKNIPINNEPLCETCKKNGIGWVQGFPRFYYEPDWQPPGFRDRPDLNALRACRPCHSTKTRCDQVKPGCSCCRERGIECVYYGSRVKVLGEAQTVSSNQSVPKAVGNYVFPCAAGWPCSGSARCYYCRDKFVKGSSVLEAVEEVSTTGTDSNLNQESAEEQSEAMLEAQRVELEGWHLVDMDEIEEDIKADGK